MNSEMGRACFPISPSISLISRRINNNHGCLAGSPRQDGRGSAGAQDHTAGPRCLRVRSCSPLHAACTLRPHNTSTSSPTRPMLTRPPA